ncbi:MAG TPA: alpha-galactosidase, partial [Clostridia bacterium]|nr:alpha-galactosidase [Clostridia bacterium]
MENSIFGKPMKLIYDQNAFDASVHITEPEQGVQFVDVVLTAKSAPALPKLSIEWETDIIDIQAQWHPGSRDTKHLMPPWAISHRANIAWCAPVYTLHNLSGINRMTFALSECVIPTEVYCAVRESEHSVFTLAAHVSPEDCMAVSSYSVTLRVDKREKHFARILEDVLQWWDSLGYIARDIPQAAREPIYSAWYAFHDQPETEQLLTEARLARKMGCKVFILDDGWNSRDESPGEAGLGDWIPSRIPDMKYLADKMHDIDMKFMLWFATPFVSKKSILYKTVADMVFDPKHDNICMDFRYKQVRDYLINTLNNAVKNWNLDGLKIDFIDSLPVKGFDPNPNDPRRDTQSVVLSIQRFFDELIEKLFKTNKDVLIEFRQNYNGPAMRKYATMFRGFDCPQDPLNNRILTSDIRLLSKGTMVNSDMFIWNLDESVEVAALQFLNVFFSVPQVSVRISMLPEEHRKMLEFYLKLWIENRDLIL